MFPRSAKCRGIAERSLPGPADIAIAGQHERLFNSLDELEPPPRNDIPELTLLRHFLQHAFDSLADARAVSFSTVPDSLDIAATVRVPLRVIDSGAELLSVLRTALAHILDEYADLCAQALIDRGEDGELHYAARPAGPRIAVGAS